MAGRSATLGDGRSGQINRLSLRVRECGKRFHAIMNTTRREFLQASAIASLASVAPAHTIALHAPSSPQQDHGKLDAFELAARHPLVRTKPGPTYFEGMLLGNGDVGVCAVVRPDALGLHISKT